MTFQITEATLPFIVLLGFMFLGSAGGWGWLIDRAIGRWQAWRQSDVPSMSPWADPESTLLEDVRHWSWTYGNAPFDPAKIGAARRAFDRKMIRRGLGERPPDPDAEWFRELAEQMSKEYPDGNE